MNKTLLLTLVMTMTITACCGQRRTVTAAVDQTTGATSSQTPICGGYTEQRPLTDQDRELFARTTADLHGVTYTPQTVATQVVAGTNYKFICMGYKARNSTLFVAEIIIFEPLPCRGETPAITAIRRLKR